jgi:hypothetical protein
MAATWTMIPALSSAAPRPKRRPSRSVGSNAGDLQQPCVETPARCQQVADGLGAAAQLVVVEPGGADAGDRDQPLEVDAVGRHPVDERVADLVVGHRLGPRCRAQATC